MKKLYTLCFSALLGLSAFAQTQPERVIVYDKAGGYTGFLAERVDSITFPKLEGRIAADLEITTVKLDTLIINVKRTEGCNGFKLKNIPEMMANRLQDDIQMAKYVADDPTQTVYYQDFQGGILSDPTLVPDSKYVLVTVGYDGYGIPCSVCRVPFQTPKRPLVGNPAVETDVEEVLPREVTVSFYPNEDVEGYAALIEKKGLLQQQFQMWAPMMQWKHIGEMVKAWGIKGGKDAIGYTWKALEPSTEYELFVQSWDVNGTFAKLDTIPVKTAMRGGEGVAAVEVTLGEYKMADWEGEQKPSQVVTYTPNDQSSCYRFNVVLASEFEKDPEGFKKDVASDPEDPNVARWYFYDPLTTDYAIAPNTDFVVLTAAKNGLSVWSEVKVDRFKTPEKVNGAAVPASIAAPATIGKRMVKSSSVYVQHSLPEFYKVQSTKVTLK